MACRRRSWTDGDPYVTQVEASAAAIAQQLGAYSEQWIITYQSRVGPLEWVGPRPTP